MTIAQAHAQKVPFYMNGKILDYGSGKEYFDPKKFAGPYEGPCFVGRDLFRTWVDGEERNWACIATGR